MYYFDRDFLMGYLEGDVDLKVFVDGVFLNIPDEACLENSIVGVGTLPNGDSREFRYKKIQQVKVDGNLFTLDDLAATRTGKPKEEPAGGAPAGGPDAGGLGGADLGGGGGGLGADIPPLTPGGGPPGEDEEEPPGGKKPDTAGVYRVGNVLLEQAAQARQAASKAPYKLGEFVENVDPACEFYRSYGPVVAIQEGCVVFKNFNAGLGGRYGEEVVKEFRSVRRKR
jgi:hypothetical protein